MSISNLIVVKVGSNVLVDEKNGLRINVVTSILETLGKAVKRGDHILLVTSGAVKLGRYLLRNKNIEISSNEAAAVGQMELNCQYQEIAKKTELVLGEILLARPHLLKREQFLKLQQTLDYFFKDEIIPLVNENDALVAGTEWTFGDNDSLATALAISLKAQKLIILSHVDGFYQGDPESNKDNKVISEVANVNKELMEYCGKTVSVGGRGGMISKLKSIRICTAVGIEAMIINGSVSTNLELALAGEKVGTLFKARKFLGNISNRQRWLLAAKNSAGSMEVDEGAEVALRAGKSLLAVGVKKVYGVFKSGEIIELINSQKEGIAFGIVDYSNDEVEEVFKNGSQHGKQLMHTDNIMILD